jgi:hypothetical protein
VGVGVRSQNSLVDNRGSIHGRLVCEGLHRASSHNGTTVALENAPGLIIELKLWIPIL